MQTQPLSVSSFLGLVLLSSQAHFSITTELVGLYLQIRRENKEGICYTYLYDSTSSLPEDIQYIEMFVLESTHLNSVAHKLPVHKFS